MKIAIGSDHRGVKLKSAVKKLLKSKKIKVEDVGPTKTADCDYPDFGFKVAEEVAEGDSDFGILICNTGIGMSITANKVKGIRAALCHNEELAKSARLHNDANILVLGAAFVDEELADKILTRWFATEFEGDRHVPRLDKIKDREEKWGDKEAWDREVEKWRKQAKMWQSRAWRR
jgi:ribose 5-phosphate isomerase B